MANEYEKFEKVLRGNKKSNVENSDGYPPDYDGG
jgi:hypothetical protein